MKKSSFIVVFLCLFTLLMNAENLKKDVNMIQNPNSFVGTDIERINKAIEAAQKTGGVVEITRRMADTENNRNFWLIDSAILLPENTTLIIKNCTIQLSNISRDNFIRSANCQLAISKINLLKNIHIQGIGNAVLKGADIPRATGDCAKKLGEQTFGSDYQNAGESQYGDWRNIGILLAHVSDFSIKGIKLVDSHAWAISLEYCSEGVISNLDFESRGWKMINGQRKTILNQDGLDLRRGCHDIQINNITGFTGDDLIALTAIRVPVTENRYFGELCKIEFSMFQKALHLEDTFNISITNIKGYSAGGHHIIRFLNNGVKIYNVIVNGVIDTSPNYLSCFATIKVGDNNPNWGGVTPLGSTKNFIINNVISSSRSGVLLAGSLQDSIISNILNINPKAQAINFASGKQYIKNVEIVK